jgi:hypothetical protein
MNINKLAKDEPTTGHEPATFGDRPKQYSGYKYRVSHRVRMKPLPEETMPLPIYEPLQEASRGNVLSLEEIVRKHGRDILEVLKNKAGTVTAFHPEFKRPYTVEFDEPLSWEGEMYSSVITDDRYLVPVTAPEKEILQEVSPPIRESEKLLNILKESAIGIKNVEVEKHSPEPNGSDAVVVVTQEPSRGGRSYYYHVKTSYEVDSSNPDSKLEPYDTVVQDAGPWGQGNPDSTQQTTKEQLDQTWDASKDEAISQLKKLDLEYSNQVADATKEIVDGAEEMGFLEGEAPF